MTLPNHGSSKFLLACVNSLEILMFHVIHVNILAIVFAVRNALILYAPPTIFQPTFPAIKQKKKNNNNK